jgi:hypothetical protein
VVEGVLSTCKTLSFNHHQKPKNNKTKTKQQHTNKAAECQPEDCSAMNDKETAPYFKNFKQELFYSLQYKILQKRIYYLPKKKKKKKKNTSRNVTTKNIDWDKSKSLKLAKSMKTEKASIEK